MKKYKDMLKKIGMEEEFNNWKETALVKKEYTYKDFKVGDRVQFVDPTRRDCSWFEMFGVVEMIRKPSGEYPEGILHVTMSDGSSLGWFPRRMRVVHE